MIRAELARRLDQCSLLSVVEAEEGLVIEPGKAYIAAGGSHLVIQPAPGSAPAAGAVTFAR